jgi:excisionase family DNA binding protein
MKASTIQEISEYFTVSQSTVLRWAQRGCPCYQAEEGSQIRFCVNEVKNWLRRSSSKDSLRDREYLTTGQCSRVFGRGSSFWREQFDLGTVSGHRKGKRGKRYIKTESARDFLEGGFEIPETETSFDEICKKIF